MEKKSKVVLLGKLPPPYMGPSLATQIILNSNLKNHFELIHVDTRAYDSLSELGKFSLKKIYRNYAIYFKLFCICLFRRPNLVVIPISQTTSGFVKDSIFVLIAWITFTKVLLQLRGSDFKRWFDHTKGFVKTYVRFVMHRAAGIIVLGQKLKYLFAEFYSDDRIYVVPNGSDYKIPSAERNKDTLKMLYLANLQPSKGIEDVLEAVKFLKQQGQNHFYLDVVGGWRTEETKKSCEALVNEFSLPVKFHPPDAGADKFMHLASADIFVFTPRAPEGHPWVMVESMCAGLPIISTDRGAITESVIHDVNGYIVSLQSPQEIADRMKQLLNDKPLREKMGRESRRLYEEKFTEGRMVENLKRTFDTVISKK